MFKQSFNDNEQQLYQIIWNDNELYGMFQECFSKECPSPYKISI